MKASGLVCRERTIRISKLGLDGSRGIDTATRIRRHFGAQAHLGQIKRWLGQSRQYRDVHDVCAYPLAATVKPDFCVSNRQHLRDDSHDQL